MKIRPKNWQEAICHFCKQELIIEVADLFMCSWLDQDEYREDTGYKCCSCGKQSLLNYQIPSDLLKIVRSLKHLKLVIW